MFLTKLHSAHCYKLKGAICTTKEITQLLKEKHFANVLFDIYKYNNYARPA